MLFTKAKHTRIKLYIDNTEIEEKRSTKFLGIKIDNQLPWKEHIKYCKGKMACRLYAMNSSKKYLNSKVLIMLYYTILYPCLSYGTLLWESSYKTHLKEIEFMQKKAIRAITNSAYNANTNVIFKELHVLK